MKTDSTWTQVLSRTDYYPFGLEMTGRTESATYRYGFNGKEKDPGGQWSNQTHYDYSFRIYNPTIGKFLSVDPLTGEFPSLSPYAYALDNPIRFIDPDGRAAQDVICPGCPSTFIGLYYGAKPYSRNWFGAANRLSTGTSGSNIPRASTTVQGVHNTMSTLNDARTVAEGVVDFGEGSAQAINSIPGADLIGDPLLAMYFGEVKGDAMNSSFYASGALVPFVSGSALKVVQTAVKNSGMLRGALSILNGSGTQAHHIIPVQALRGNAVVQKAVGNGFDFNGAINGIEGAADFHTNHPAYNAFVSNQLNSFQQSTGGAFTGQQAQEFLQNELVPVLRRHYNDALQSGESLNSYFKKLNN